ncbi:M28 family metallopeptidase [Fibrella sp. WM1]|uniref:M28 family metallopeptidase n=1 Tax=Fibrella musci TaxID=3242485 RepID=UPI0035231051
MKSLAISILLISNVPGVAWAQTNRPPHLSAVQFDYDSVNACLNVSYHVADAEEANVTVNVAVFDASGLPVDVPSWGAINQPLTANTQHAFAVDLSAYRQRVSALTYRLTADDGVPVPFDELISRIDTNRLKRRLTAISGVRHPSVPAGLKHLLEVRDLLNQSFQSFNCVVRQQPFQFAGYAGQNVIATSTGTAATPVTYALTAAYDGNWVTPGANMNASGVAGMLEVMEILAAYPHKNRLTAIGLDYSGDDEFVGANYYLFKGGLSRRENLLGTFNFDRIGSYNPRARSLRPDKDFAQLFPAEQKKLEADSLRANFMTIVSNHASRHLADAVVRHAQHYAPHLRYVLEDYPGYGECTGGSHCTIFKVQQSDHVIFWYRRLPTLHITDGHAGEYIDSQEDDTVDKINFSFMRQLLSTNLAALAELVGVQHAHSITLKVN